jgi:hypothetical protein
LSLFTGVIAEQQNINNWGDYVGIYVDGAIIVSYDGKWRGGLFATTDWSKFEGYSTYDQNKRFEVASGVNVGFYDEDFSIKHQLFIGLNLGIKYSHDNDGRITPDGTYSGQQTDYSLVGNINLNLLKAFNLTVFPRTQLVFSWQATLNSQKKSFWNNEELLNAPPWDKSYWELVFKESIVSAKLGSVRLDFKAVAGYDHYAKGDPDGYIIGGEISIHKDGRDDFLSIYTQEKLSSRFDYNFVAAGISLNIIQMFR